MIYHPLNLNNRRAGEIEKTPMGNYLFPKVPHGSYKRLQVGNYTAVKKMLLLK
jgi:hypothetical protein